MRKSIKKELFKPILSKEIFICSDHLGGIFSKLLNQSSSVDEYLNLFTVTEKCAGSGIKESVFNPEDSALYWTCGGNDPSDKWIQIEMKDLYLKITGYVLMSIDDPCCHFLKSWYLEGRNSDAEEWKRIDERSNEEELDGQKKVKSFRNNVLTSCTFRKFRLMVTDNFRHNSNYGTYVVINEMDFFGHVVKTPNNNDNCNTRDCSRRSTSVFVSFLIVHLIT